MGTGLVRGSRVGIVGGSIAGCAVAIALDRLGCDVDVFERSSGVLRDRGSGIAIPLPLRDELIAGPYLPSDYAHCVVERHWWILDDGSAQGRRLWEQTGVGVHNNWGLLWRSLRAGVADAHYHDGVSVRGFEDDGGGVVARFADGSSERFDVLIGADGYRSFIRGQLQPDSRCEYAGYVLWRGNSRSRDFIAATRSTVAAMWARDTPSASPAGTASST
jgi:2-polyprenyl-6-methoxyphenol hydroxylase-like FAD-dependent oxidoreductase